MKGVWNNRNEPKVIAGSMTYFDTGGEQTIFEITDVPYFFVSGIILNISALTQNGTFKIYMRAYEGGPYILLAIISFTISSLLCIPIGANYNYRIPVDFDLKLTYIEDVDEGVDRNIAYKYTLEN